MTRAERSNLTRRPFSRNAAENSPFRESTPSRSLPSVASSNEHSARPRLRLGSVKPTRAEAVSAYPVASKSELPAKSCRFRAFESLRIARTPSAASRRRPIRASARQERRLLSRFLIGKIGHSIVAVRRNATRSSRNRAHQCDELTRLSALPNPAFPSSETRSARDRRWPARDIALLCLSGLVHREIGTIGGKTALTNGHARARAVSSSCCERCDAASMKSFRAVEAPGAVFARKTKKSTQAPAN